MCTISTPIPCLVHAFPNAFPNRKATVYRHSSAMKPLKLVHKITPGGSILILTGEISQDHRWTSVIGSIPVCFGGHLTLRDLPRILAKGHWAPGTIHHAKLRLQRVWEAQDQRTAVLVADDGRWGWNPQNSPRDIGGSFGWWDRGRSLSESWEQSPSHFWDVLTYRYVQYTF